MSRPMGIVLTQTVITLTAGTSTSLVPFNTQRKYLAITNIGTNPASLAFDAPAVVASGYPLVAADVLGDQGGGLIWESVVMPLNAINAISSVGTTIVVLEGV